MIDPLPWDEAFYGDFDRGFMAVPERYSFFKWHVVHFLASLIAFSLIFLATASWHTLQL